MRRVVLSGVIVAALLGAAAAWVSRDDDEASSRDHTGSVTPRQAQKQVPDVEFAPRRTAETDGVAPLENGVVPGASRDGETAPAKFSERNADADRPAIMARPLPLTDAQRRRIYELVMSGGPKQETADIEAEPATILPGTVALHELPQRLADEVPALRGYKYVKLDDRVVIVSPPNRVVVDEIASEPAQ